MENNQNARFDKLEALIENRFADIKADLKDTHRQLEAKDAQIAALWSASESQTQSRCAQSSRRTISNKF